MLKKEYPYYLANEAVYANQDLKIYDKYNGELATVAPLATPDVLDQAISAACDAADAMAKMPMFERQAVLEHCVVTSRALQISSLTS